MDIDALIRPELGKLSAYAPPETSATVRLDANEAPDILPDAAVKSVHRALTDIQLGRYPDARQSALRSSIAECMDVDTEQVVAGTGSDELIALLLQTFGRAPGRHEKPTMLSVTPAFPMYKHSATALGYRVIEVPLDASWDLDLKSMLRAVQFAPPNLIFVASPNNPTAKSFDPVRVEQLIKAAPQSLVVIDEAYVDYAHATMLDLVRTYDNVAVLRTLSKVGFAAIRVGWLVGSEGVIRALHTVRQPFNLSTPAQRAAALILNELQAERAELVSTVVEQRERLSAELSSLGMEVSPSDANFLWVKSPIAASVLAKRLEAEGVRIRQFATAVGRLTDRVRITVGSASENDRLLEALARIMKESR